MELFWFVIGIIVFGVLIVYDFNVVVVVMYGWGFVVGRDYIILLFWIFNRIDSDLMSFIGIIGWNDLV